MGAVRGGERPCAEWLHNLVLGRTMWCCSLATEGKTSKTTQNGAGGSPTPRLPGIFCQMRENRTEISVLHFRNGLFSCLRCWFWSRSLKEAVRGALLSPKHASREPRAFIWFARLCFSCWQELGLCWRSGWARSCSRASRRGALRHGAAGAALLFSPQDPEGPVHFCCEFK